VRLLDINARDRKGSSVLHIAVQNKLKDVLMLLGMEGCLVDMDPTLQDENGETVIAVAERLALSVASNPNPYMRAEREDILFFIQEQLKIWDQHVRPLILGELSTVLIPDLASMVMDYVDGRNRQQKQLP